MKLIVHAICIRCDWHFTFTGDTIDGAVKNMLMTPCTKSINDEHGIRIEWIQVAHEIHSD